MGAFEDGLAAKACGDFGLAEKHWRQLAETGDPKAQYVLCYLYADKLGQPDEAAAMAEQLKIDADAGQPNHAEGFLIQMTLQSAEKLGK